MKKVAMAMMLMVLATFAAEPTVSGVKAKQRYPWNGLVDITCKVTGIEGTTNGIYFSVAAVPETGDALKGSQFWLMQNGVKTTGREVSTNGNYRLLWDAQADLGTAIYSNMVVRVALKSHDKVQLWDGGPYWATVNIGADEPWESGYYFWWGDTIGYKREDDAWVASDGSSSNFSFSEENAPTCGKNIDTLKNESWITADGVLAPEHDAAHVQWGGGWRMPTDLDLDNLKSRCDWSQATMKGVNGYIVRGRGGYASASIFLPIAGAGHGNQAFGNGYCWSSVPYDNSHSWVLYYINSYVGHSMRQIGNNIRAVQGFDE